MNVTEDRYCNAIKLEMKKLRWIHPEYPESFQSDCNAYRLKKKSPEVAAAELCINYGWMDRPVKIRIRKKKPMMPIETPYVA